MEPTQTYWDYDKKEHREETIYAGNFIDRLYNTRRGKVLNYLLYSRKYFNWYFGWYKNSPRSLPQVERDIKDFHINLHEFEPFPNNSYSDFFLRRFKKGARPFSKRAEEFCAFAEGNYFIFKEITKEITFPVKGEDLSVTSLLGSNKEATSFEGGSIIICRLCPIDYHHFHYPDEGTLLKSYDVKGGYHSVNPFALISKSDIFCKNYRRISLLETKNFGKLAYIEVGAMVVGKIVQTHSAKNFKKGDLKGHFEYGASTVIIVTQKNVVSWDKDILLNSQKGIESKVKLGRTLGTL